MCFILDNNNKNYIEDLKVKIEEKIFIYLYK